MCGIAGTFGKCSHALDEALNLMAHRGPDGRDIVCQDYSALAHTRLAIVDVGGGHQPLSNHDETQWLVCNGEIYNHASLRAEYPDYPFKTNSDSEIILALYGKYGPEAVKLLDGMFAFALLDGDRLLLARDPLGIKPLYYGWERDTLHFASEIKALQHVVDSIYEFPPGHWYDSETGFTRYYHVPSVAEEQQHAQNDAPSFAMIRDALQQAVHKRLMSDVPLGVFLSGGLDSSIVAAFVAKNIPDVHSFAVGMEGSQDLQYAQQVADYVGTQHHVYTYTLDEMVEVLPDVIYHLESFDPPLVRSAIPNFFLTRLAGEYVTVVLSGEGADELFSGYHYLKKLDTVDDIYAELVEITGALHNCNLQRLDRMAMAHSLEGRVPFLDTDFVALSFAVPIEQKIYGDNDIEKWALRKACEGLLPPDVIWRKKEKFSEGAGSCFVIEQLAETEIDDETFLTEVQTIFAQTGNRIRSKEELYYYRIFQDFFDASAASLVGLWPGH